MTSIKLAAPAKVNLVLKVLGRRPDGYHNILTLFGRISLCDTVTLTKRRRGVTVDCDRRVTGRMRDNIAYRAARLALDAGKAPGGVGIRIRKRIPVAAGLGGGSSDAAAVLTGINKLYNLNISRNTLMRIGRRLGADVPFFLLDEPFAVGRSRGDRLEKADIRLKPWHLIVYPGRLKASTAAVYGDFDARMAPRGRRSNCLTSRTGGAKIALPRDWTGLVSLLCNDLGDVVAETDPVIGNTIRCLVASLSNRVIVSGSGPSLFCLYRTRKEAVAAVKRLRRTVPAARRRRWRVFVAGTI
jgi:4-diphosphocytidyl-2-C-methyl-D-erythritol kinase